MELLCASPPPARSTTASRTLIGRLLYDSKPIFEDQLEAVERTSRQRGRRVHEPRAAHRRPARRARAGHHDRRRLPLLRHARSASSSSPTRPGHMQYTRNMVTGASTADLALDPRRRAQRHHRAVAAARVPRVAAAASRTSCCASTRWTSSTTTRSVFERIKDEFREFAAEARRRRPHVHPDLGAARRQRRRPLRQHALVRGLVAAAPPRRGAHRLRPQPHRLPLPGAVRASARTTTSYHDYRGYAGQVAGGIFKPGDEVVVLPSGFTSTIAPIDTADGPGRRGVPADVGHDPPRPTTSTSAAAT